MKFPFGLYKDVRDHILADQRNSGYIRIYYDYVPDTAAAVINRASELLRTDSADSHHEALRLLQTVAHDSRASNALGAANLDFFLRADLTVPGGSPAWTPIGTVDDCFAGTFHGDGYTISALDHSLFGHLCGSVYNLGVTGSFTEAGVANSGSG